MPTQARLSPPWRSWPEKADSPQPQPSGESVAAIVALDPAALDPAQARLIPLACLRAAPMCRLVHDLGSGPLNSWPL